ncbi:MAG: MqnA/MqnD/SBP family protein [Planctomycetota bacterium]
MHLKVCYSPDADDVFMFWALEKGLIPSSHRFTFGRRDTQSLNLLAARGEADICAVSAAAVPGLLKQYRLLPHGGSVGDNYGPVVVTMRHEDEGRRARRPYTNAESMSGRAGGVPRSDESRGSRQGDTPCPPPPEPVAIPGEHTTAALVLRLLHPGIRTVEVPISPFAEAFNCLRDGRASASLLIHEGRLTYEREGCELIEDIGISWMKRTGLPLPLGVNVIRRDLPETLQRELESLLRESLKWAKMHRDTVIKGILQEKLGNLRTHDELVRYLDLYANDDTQQFSSRAVDGLRRLFAEGSKAGLLRTPVPQSELDGSYWR